jgi:hypothetical protein
MRNTVTVSPAAPLPSRLIGVADRVPASLANLAGPEHGRVSLPVRLAWSGPNEFDVDDPGQRLTLYRILLDCGQRDDIIRYINPELLRRDWSRIRRLTARRLIALWEQILPDLADAS